MALNDIIVPRENAQGTFDEIALPDATTSARGLLTSADKTKLDGIATGATANTASTTTPAALGVAAAGTATAYAREDHVHAMPSAADIGLGAADDVTFNSVTATTLTNIAGEDLVATDANGALTRLTGSGIDLNNVRASLELGTAATADSTDFASASHTHAASDITSGTLDIARIPTGTGSTQVALGNHTHELTALAATGASNGTVLTANGSGGVTFAAASGGGVTTGSVDHAVLRADGTGGSTSQSSDLVIDDATTSTQNNVALQNNHSETNSALVLTPKGTGAFIVGPKPDGTSTGGNARGTDAICMVRGRNNANQVASGTQSVAIGYRARAGGVSVVIGSSATDQGSNNVVAIGTSATGTTESTAVGNSASATGIGSVSIGQGTASGGDAVQIKSVSTANLRAQFLTKTFGAVYWNGQTTNNTATILNLDNASGQRFTIAASSALAVDILLVARRATTQDKWLVARRFLGIRRDGSNNTALIGAVQTLGTDQSAGSPTWTFALTADDTNEALQLEVTGATGETVEWRATAFYRVA